MTARNLTVVLLAALTLGVGAHQLLGSRGAASADDDEGAPVRPIVTVQVGKLERRTMYRIVTGYGVVEPAPATSRHPAAAAAVAASVTGVVTQVLVAAGQNVRRGQVLVRLNSDSQTQQYAAQQVARLQRLFAQHNASLKDLQHAEAQLALLQVTAPLAGTVVSVDVTAGTAVSPSTVLVEVIDQKRLVVRAGFPEPPAGALEPGQIVRLSRPKAMTLRLAYVSPTIDPKTGAVMTWASLPANSGLRPGQYVRLAVVTATHPDSLVAPDESVVSNLTGQGVLSVVRGGEAVRVPVRVGLREDGWVEVRGSGLFPGTPVVTVGAYGLPARVAIRIVHPR
jgi:membrane fusion protein (multidrug efflux system)